MPKNIQSMINDELEKFSLNTSIVRNEQIFDPEYLPDELPHRQEQILDMTKFFSGIFSQKSSKTYFRQSLILVGPSGSGKSVTAKRFGFDIQDIAMKKIQYFHLKYFYLNCRQSRTVYLLLIKLLRGLIPNFPKRGLSVSELIRELLDVLEKKNLYIIIALDEIEFLIRDTEINNLLYTFTRINDESNATNKQRFSVIVVTRNREFLYSLDSSTKSSLSKNLIEFSSYTQQQLKDILIKKIEFGLSPNIIEEKEIDSIVDYTYKNGSDMRIALELLRISCKIAEYSNQVSINSEIVNEAIKRIFPINREIIRDLPMTQKVTLLSIAKVFKNLIDSQRVTLSIVKRQYHIECNKYNLSLGQGHTSFWSYIQKLDELSLIKARVVNYGTKGRSTEIDFKIPVGLIIIELEELIKKELDKKRKFEVRK
ncbi:MAG: Cdc6/Cdc18 family protein [Candidatus Hodarchaeales archaeon]|jgi:cell division control protein 6